jgi:hypothetical protein
MKGTLFKVIFVFSAGGLAAGVLTVLISHFTPWVVWAGVGIVFLFGLTISFVIACEQGWLSVRASRTRYLISAIVVIASYPIAFLAVFESVFLYHWVYRALLPAEWQERLSHETESFYIGLLLAAVLSAILISCALKLVTGKWDGRVVALLIIAGVTAIVMSFAIAAIIRHIDRNSFYEYPVLFILGEAFFGGLSGYWLLRASRGNQEVTRALN